MSELGAAVGMLLLHDFHFFIYENLEIFQKTEIMGLEEAMDIKKKVDMCKEGMKNDVMRQSFILELSLSIPSLVSAFYS